MNYTKPEVAVLGKATRVIETSNTYKPIMVVKDGLGLFAPTPAYDLDE
jgi:hypothetical protein